MTHLRLRARPFFVGRCPWAGPDEGPSQPPQEPASTEA
jgi:hypothetical protein